MNHPNLLRAETCTSMASMANHAGGIQAAVERRHKKFSWLVLFILSFIVSASSAAVCVVCLSSVVAGQEVLAVLQRYTIVKQVSFLVLGVCVFVLYMVDFFIPPHLEGRLFAIRGNAPYCCFPAVVLGVAAGFCGCLFLASSYPWTPLLAVLFACPLGLLAVEHMTNPGAKVRIKQARDRIQQASVVECQERLRDSSTFFLAASHALLLVAAIVLASWLAWIFEPSDEGDVATVRKVFTQAERDAGYVLWVAPGIVVLAYILFAFLLRLHLRLQCVKLKQDSATVGGLTERVSAVVRENAALVDLKHAVGWLAMSVCTLLAVNYTIYSLFSEFQTFTAMVQAFLVGVLSTSGLYVYYSFKELFWALHADVMTHPLVKGVWGFRHSDWARAMIIFGFGLIAAPFILLSMFNQCVRKRRRVYRTVDRDKEGTTQQITQEHMPDEFPCTPKVHALLNYVLGGDVIRVIIKVYILALFGITTVVTPGALNVFLAWMMSILSDLHFATICAVLYVVGLVMFLLPPVPGAPIYLFGGVLLAGKGMEAWGKDRGFWLGTTICVFVGTACKISSCAIQQKVFGEQLGRSLWVRQTVGVHKPLIRAIEIILRKPGLTWGKSFILVGGPDWPTSVLCGILKLPLCQCMVGTLPVLFFIMPFTCTGSFYVKADEGEVWKAMGEFMFTITAVFTAGLSASIWWQVQACMTENAEEIAMPKEEYLELDWRDYMAEQIARETVVHWRQVPCLLKVVFLSGVVVDTAVFHLFYWSYPTCFGTFSVTDSISSLDFYGHSGSLVKQSGVAGLGAAVVGCFGWIFVSFWKTCKTKITKRRATEAALAQEESWKAQRTEETRRAKKLWEAGQAADGMPSLRRSQPEVPAEPEKPAKPAQKVQHLQFGLPAEPLKDVDYNDTQNLLHSEVDPKEALIVDVKPSLLLSSGSTAAPAAVEPHPPLEVDALPRRASRKGSLASDTDDGDTKVDHAGSVVERDSSTKKKKTKKTKIVDRSKQSKVAMKGDVQHPPKGQEDQN